MGSCLGARRRKGLRDILLKLFSRDLAFIVISYFWNATGPCRPSPRCSGGILQCLFRGRNKSDNVTGWGYIFLSRRARLIAARYSHEVRFESVR